MAPVNLYPAKQSRGMRAIAVCLTVIVLGTLIGLIYFAAVPDPSKAVVRRIEQGAGFVSYEFHGPIVLRNLLGNAYPWKTPFEINLGFNSTDTELATLLPLRDAKVVSLNGTQIKGSGLLYLTNFHALEILDLTKSRVGNDGLRYLTNLTHLRTLILAQLDIGDEGVFYLQYLPHLENLNIERTRVTDIGVTCLLKLPLKTLDVRGTKLTGQGISMLTNAIHTLEYPPKLE